MFKLTVPIIKSFEKDNGMFAVEGIASDPTIDRDEERFETSAIDKMIKAVNKGSIPIRVEHENKVYTEIGVWTEAGLDENDRMYVKGEIETELSLGNDMKVLLKRGMDLALSVGGRVLDAGFEFNKELNKTIKVYKDVGLEEISIIKNPSNYNTALSMAKSVNWKQLEIVTKETTNTEFPYSTQAEQLISVHKGMKLVPHSEAKELLEKDFQIKEVAKKKGKVKGKKYLKQWGKDVMKKLDPWFDKVCYAIDCDICEDDDDLRLTTEDLKMIGQLMSIMAQVDLPEERPSILDDSNFWAELVEEQQIVLFNRAMTMPHHDKDLSLNRDLVLWYTKIAVDGQAFYTPKDFTVIIGHLYRHLKEMALVKAKKEGKEFKVEKSNVTKEEVILFKTCAEFMSGNTFARPTNNGQPVSDIQIQKCSEAYALYINNNNNTMAKDTTVTKEEEVVAEETTKVEETATTDKEETTKVEVEKKEVVEETKKEEVKEVEKTEEKEEKKEEVKEVEKEEEKKEEVKEEVQKKVLVTEETFDKAAFSKIEKSVTKLAEIVENLVEKAKDSTTIQKSVTDLTTIVEKQGEILTEMSKLSKGRKSIASFAAIEKAFQSTHETTSTEEKTLKAMEEGASFQDAYKAGKAQ